jgi:hypothetical protein
VDGRQLAVYAGLRPDPETLVRERSAGMEWQRLPPWGDDPLSTFLANGEHNVRVTSLNCPDVYGVQQWAHALLARIGELIEQTRTTSTCSSHGC